MLRNMHEMTIVSNRLPITLERSDGHWTAALGRDGLLEAINPILRDSGAQWVGWPGRFAEGEQWRAPLRSHAESQGYQIDPVMLADDEMAQHDAGFAHSVLWPLFHGFADYCDFEEDYFRAYLEVNRQFALQIARSSQTADRLWVHDYHLIHAAHMLRAAQASLDRIGFFLHIPFPSLDTYRRLPQAAQILRALLAYDLIGFQTDQYLSNFTRCVERLMPGVRVEATKSGAAIDLGHRVVRAGSFPVGVDFDDFSRRACSRAVGARMEQLRGDIRGRKLLLGVDRLDYTKGLLHKLHAYEDALDRYPELREEVVLYQVMLPSRENVAAYGQLKDEIDRVVGRICGRFSTLGWSPIIYRYTAVPRPELSAMYRLAAAALVTPLRDGMNLVAKEYVASQVDESGVLLLSEFAGAAEQLGEHALTINPYDIRGTADGIHRAVTLRWGERVDRIRRMREVVRDSDVYGWADQFMSALGRSLPGAAPGRQYLVGPEKGSMELRPQ